MDITNTIRLYAECISGGAITEPTGGSWMSAICIWQGSTEPLNASWLQRHCDNLGITAPLNGSYLIALADHYGETEPINGTWANAILVGCGAVPTDLIWNLTTTEWQDETTLWDSGAPAPAPAPPAPATVQIVFQMIDSYGDGWNNGSIIIQKETSPGVWENQAYDGNPYYYNNQTEFNSDLLANRLYYNNFGSAGPYALTFRPYEYGVSSGGLAPFPTGSTWTDTQDIRTLTLETGFNYRTLVWGVGSFTEERSYNVKNGGTTIASFGPEPDTSQWVEDYIQTTFTL